MAKIKSEKYDYDVLKDYFRVDPDSDSGLMWIESPGKRFKNTRAGYRRSLERASTGYWEVKLFKGYHLLVHRIVWILSNKCNLEDKVIDHIDGNGLNNKIENLRAVDMNLNNKNKRLQLNNKTEISGVSFVTQPSTNGIDNLYYRAYCPINGKTIQRNFSIKKYGDDLAFLLAICWRQWWLEEDGNFGKDHGNARQIRS